MYFTDRCDNLRRKKHKAPILLEVIVAIEQGFLQVLRKWHEGLCPPLPQPLRGGALQNLIGGGGLESIHRASMGGLKMLLKNTCEGVHLIIKLPSIRACKPANLLTSSHIFFKDFG